MPCHFFTQEESPNKGSNNENGRCRETIIEIIHIKTSIVIKQEERIPNYLHMVQGNSHQNFWDKSRFLPYPVQWTVTFKKDKNNEEMMAERGEVKKSRCVSTLKSTLRSFSNDERWNLAGGPHCFQNLCLGVVPQKRQAQPSHVRFVRSLALHRFLP